MSDVLRVHEWSYVLAIKQVLCLAAACVWDWGATGVSCRLNRMCSVHHRPAAWGSRPQALYLQAPLTNPYKPVHLAPCKVSSPSAGGAEYLGWVHAKTLKPGRLLQTGNVHSCWAVGWAHARPYQAGSLCALLRPWGLLCAVDRWHAWLLWLPERAEY